MKIPSYNEIVNNKKYITITNILFPLMLVAFGLCKVTKGIDITDTAYNYGNFVYLNGLDEMWYCSTFLANITGRVFTYLPFGQTLLGLNIYTGIIKCIIALCGYYFLSYKCEIRKELVLFGELAALGLCWCPTSLLYNYLSYLLFFLGSAFLYEGLIKEKGKLLFVAGVCLGLNIFVRFPNICEAGLIVALWYYCIVKRESFKKCLAKTGLCLLGYITAAAVLYGIIAILKGPSGYVNAIRDLFSMTDEASQYSGTGMLQAIFYAYRDTLFWIKYIAAVLAAVFLMGYFIPEKFDKFKYVAIVLLTTGLFAVLYRNHLFTFNYSDYSSVYNFGSVMQVLILLVLLPPVFMKNLKMEIRLLSVISIGIILITPLGTNNAIYASLNNMFFIFPVFLYILSDCVKVFRQLGFVKFAMVLIVAVYFYQVFNFGLTFVFRDGYESPMNEKVYGYDTLKGMYTEKDNASMLEDIAVFISDYDNDDRQLLLYGNVPGMAFYLKMQPAISSTWPSLDSYNTQKFAGEIDRITEAAENEEMELPVIITDTNTLERFNTGEMSAKEIKLKEFIDKYDYKMIYNSSSVVLYLIQNNK